MLFTLVRLRLTMAPQHMSPEPTELQPPPEHEGKIFHWLLSRHGAAEVWEWKQKCWRTAGMTGFYTPGGLVTEDYRYLGPAEWKPDRDDAPVAMNEDFRSFYSRTTGCPWMAVSGEETGTVNRRLASALAEWCDALAKQVEQAISELKEPH